MAINNNHPSDDNLEGVRGRPATPEEISQRNSYAQGRNDENYTQQNLRAQERIAAQAKSNDSAASGLMIGFLIALLAAGTGVAFYFLSGDRTNVIPVAVPQIEKETIIEKETTVIEKESEPSPVSLPDVQVDVPDVNITNEATSEPEPEPIAEPKAEPAPELVAEPVTDPAADPAAETSEPAN